MIKHHPDTKSIFRILKGGKISLVVSALLAGTISANAGVLYSTDNSISEVTFDGNSDSYVLEHNITVNSDTAIGLRSAVSDDLQGLSYDNNITISDGSIIHVDGLADSYAIYVDDIAAGSNITLEGGARLTTHSSGDVLSVGIAFDDNNGTIAVQENAMIDVNASNVGAGLVNKDGANNGTISNAGIMNITGIVAYGIEIGYNNHTVENTNSGTINVYTSGLYGFGLYVGFNDATVTNSGSITVQSASSLLGNGIGIKSIVNNSGGLISNEGNITINDVYKGVGIDVGANNGNIINSGKIDVNASGYFGYGINVIGDGNITNTKTGTITVNDSGYASGITIFGNGNIENNGTIITTIDGHPDASAYSISTFGTGTITNNGILSGNIYVYGTLNNYGTICLPSDANDIKASFIDNFTNEASGTLVIGVDTNEINNIIHSQLETSSAIFQDDSTIFVNVSADANATTITNALTNGEALEHVVVSNSPIDINASNVSVKDNSALADWFIVMPDANTIDLNITVNSIVETLNCSLNNGLNTEGCNGDANCKQNAQAIDDVIDASGMSTLRGELLALGSVAEVKHALDSLTPEVANHGVGTATQLFNNFQSIVDLRQNIHFGATGANSGDRVYGEKNLWLKPFGINGEQKEKDALNGYDISARGMGMGMDAEYDQNAKAGFAFFAVNADTKVHDIDQSSNIKSYTLMAYGNKPIDARTNFLFQAGYAWLDTENTRVLFNDDVASSDFTSHMASLDLKVMRDYEVTSSLLLQPIVSATYRHYDAPSYSETGAGDAGLHIETSSIDQMILSIGTFAHYNINTKEKLIGSAMIGYDTIDDRASVVSNYLGATGTTFTTVGIDNGPWSYDISLGYEHELNDNTFMNISLSRQGEGSKFYNNAISGMFNFKF